MELFDENAPDNMPGEDTASLFFSEGIAEALKVPPALKNFFELSCEAYYAAVYARMSGLPVTEETRRFIARVGSARGRSEAARIAGDRGDSGTRAVLAAAGKVAHEIHRLTGFLRFSPDENGVYTARCAPDYFVLPALEPHFSARFGGTPWAIIDEKRRLRLYREKSGEARLVPSGAQTESADTQNNTAERKIDQFEDLWKLYHKSVVIETRKNPALQRKFMPEKYRKYLPEAHPNK